MFLNFFVNCSIIDAKVIFVTPTYDLWYLISSERCTPIIGIVILDFAGLLFRSTKWRAPKNIKKSKTF